MRSSFLRRSLGRSAFSLVSVFSLGLGAAAESPWNEPVRRFVLENGLTVLYQQDRSSAVTALELLIRGGRRAEPGGKAGTAYLVSRLMLEMPDDRSARRLMVLASPLSLSIEGDFCLIEAESLSGHLEETLKLLARSLWRPLFSPVRIDPLKDFMSHLRKRETEYAFSHSRILSLREWFGAEGYGASSFGTDESVAGISARLISEFYETHVRAGNLVLAVVSDREADDIRNLLEKHFKDVKPGPISEQPSPAPPPRRRATYEVRIQKETLQSAVTASFLLPGSSPRFFVLASLAESLIGNGVASRLWALRQEQKLAYRVTCSYLPLKEAGVLGLGLETDNQKLDTARRALEDILDDLSNRGATSDELVSALEIAGTDFLRENEDKIRRARNLAVYEALGLGFDYLEQYPALLASVTLEELNAFFRTTVAPSRALWITVAGNRNPPH